jgi:hypothetical protein
LGHGFWDAYHVKKRVAGLSDRAANSAVGAWTRTIICVPRRTLTPAIGMEAIFAGKGSVYTYPLIIAFTPGTITGCALAKNAVQNTIAEIRALILILLIQGKIHIGAKNRIRPLNMCPKCGGTMKVIAFIEEAVVIETRSTGCAESTAKPPEGLQPGWLQ